MSYETDYYNTITIVLDDNEENPIDIGDDVNIEDNPQYWKSISNELLEIDFTIFKKIVENMIDIGGIKTYAGGSLPLHSSSGESFRGEDGVSLALNENTLWIDYSMSDKTKLEEKLEELAEIIDRDTLLSEEVGLGPFTFSNNGSVKYNGEQFPLQLQLQNILKYFLEAEDGTILSVRDIRDSIFIRTEERSHPSASSVRQYISKLNNALLPILQYKPIKNEARLGWKLKLNR